jgi:hypothetical protein
VIVVVVLPCTDPGCTSRCGLAEALVLDGGLPVHCMWSVVRGRWRCECKSWFLGVGGLAGACPHVEAALEAAPLALGGCPGVST